MTGKGMTGKGMTGKGMTGKGMTGKGMTGKGTTLVVPTDTAQKKKGFSPVESWSSAKPLQTDPNASTPGTADRLT
jgi:hypothetical protein